MRIDWENQKGLPSEFKVYRAKSFDRKGEDAWAAWYVGSIEAAREMVAIHRAREPREYPLAETWVVARRGKEVDRFTTKDVAKKRVA